MTAVEEVYGERYLKDQSIKITLNENNVNYWKNINSLTYGTEKLTYKYLNLLDPPVITNIEISVTIDKGEYLTTYLFEKRFPNDEHGLYSFLKSTSSSFEISAELKDRLSTLRKKITETIDINTQRGDKLNVDYYVYHLLSIVDEKLYQALEYIYRKEYDLAINECLEVIKIEPNNSTAYERLGSAYFLLGKKDEAKKVWEKALKLDPKNRHIPKFLEQIDKTE